MTIRDLVQLYGKAPQVENLRKSLEEESAKTVFLEGLVASSAPLLFASLSSPAVGTATGAAVANSKFCTLNSQLFFVLPDEEEAGYFYNDLKQLLGEEQVLFFPSSFRCAIKYAQRDAANEILRTEVLTRLTSVAGTAEAPSRVVANSPLSTLHSPLNIVTYPEAIAEQVMSRQQLEVRTLVLRQGQTVEVGQVVKTLRDLDFHEVDYVYEPGQFAQRGSILDVYSFSSEYPFRIDFFGDDIDSIRTFEVEDQLSRDKREQISIVGENSPLSPLNSPLSPLSSLFSYLYPHTTVIIAKDYQYVRDAIDRTCQEADANEVQTITGEQWMKDTASFRKIVFGQQTSIKPDVTLSFHTAPQPLFHKNFDLLRQSFADYQSQGYHLYVLADSPKQLDRLKDILTSSTDETSSATRTAVANSPLSALNSKLNYIPSALHAGFLDHDLRLGIFTDHEIFDRFHRYHLRSERARSGKAALTLKEIQQFEVGDYIVHVDHGIGKFGGLVRMPIQSPQPTSPISPTKYQEMIKIIYQGGGSIYVSIHSLYKVSKYKAQDNGEPPRLSQLGTGQWERMKERTKNKLKDIARDLIKLYAERKRSKGFAFSADSFMQHELEASFLYEDTPDQLKTTNEVKEDMEKARPMDRLVCGDVGFGKTEIAVRAAFKAASDSKQVAVLVPTTVLAYQHYQTFSKRLKDFPVRVDYLTRARSAKQTKDLLQDLADGKIDIVIGTHKLIGKSVRFKDLGLLIIDEEQKFGVSTKEKLRQMKANVDTLTLTATPIPRTLQFSLMGARDLSIIQTPPPNRYPIQTEIHTLSPDIVAEAINFELSRNGQVYFVNPRINDLQRIAEIIQRYVPDARLAIGHGQMKPDELEKIIFDFINYDYDVLLSTTIIENGIDIPNANTIIINGAHHFGLSDLHQMRGRVGRGNRKA